MASYVRINEKAGIEPEFVTENLHILEQYNQNIKEKEEQPLDQVLKVDCKNMEMKFEDDTGEYE